MVSTGSTTELGSTTEWARPTSGLDRLGGLEQRVGRDHGDAGRDRDLAGGVLAAHLVHHVGGGTDQRDAGVLEGAGERGALGEEAVSGVHRVGTAVARGGDDLVDVEVAGDPDRGVGLAGVRCGRVDVGVDRDRVDAEVAGGADHPQGDLAAVGDEQRLHHGPHIRKMP
jgi:hypothetical protein